MKSLFIFIMCSLFTLACIGRCSAEPKDEIQITILYDNYVAQEGLEADWGFACLIEGMEKKILFDTGTNGDLLLRNAETPTSTALNWSLYPTTTGIIQAA